MTSKPVDRFVEAIRGVLSVTGNVSDLTSHVVQERARWAYYKKLQEVLK